MNEGERPTDARLGAGEEQLLLIEVEVRRGDPIERTPARTNRVAEQLQGLARGGARAARRSCRDTRNPAGAHHRPVHRADGRRLGLDITAFIGVLISHPALIPDFERRVTKLDDVLECHHVTGEYTLLLKAKTANTSSLERLISQIRSIEGVGRTETLVVLSTHTERVQLSLDPEHSGAAPSGRRTRRNGAGAVQLRRA